MDHTASDVAFAAAAAAALLKKMENCRALELSVNRHLPRSTSHHHGSRISLFLSERSLKRCRMALVPPGGLSDEALNEKPRDKTSQHGKRLPRSFALDGRRQASNRFALENLALDSRVEESLVTLPLSPICRQTLESALALLCCEVAQIRRFRAFKWFLLHHLGIALCLICQVVLHHVQHIVDGLIRLRILHFTVSRNVKHAARITLQFVDYRLHVPPVHARRTLVDHCVRAFMLQLEGLRTTCNVKKRNVCARVAI